MRTLDTEQAALAASTTTQKIELVKLTTYTDRDAETVSNTYYLSHVPVLYDYGNTGTDRQFEPFLVNVSQSVESMPNMPEPGDLSAMTGSRVLTLRNGDRDGTSLWEILLADQVESARVEIARLGIEGSSARRFYDQRALTGSEHTVLYRGRVAQVRGVSNDEITLLIERDWPEIPWLIANDEATVAPRDVGRRVQIVYGSVEKVPAIGWKIGWITTTAGSIETTDTTIELTDARGIASTGTNGLWISGDLISWTGKTGNQLTGVTGLDFSHVMGELVREVVEPATWLVNSEESDAVPEVYVRNPFTEALVRLPALLYSIVLDDTGTVSGRTVTSIMMTDGQLALLFRFLASGVVPDTSEIRHFGTHHGALPDATKITPGGAILEDDKTNDRFTPFQINGGVNPRQNLFFKNVPGRTVTARTIFFDITVGASQTLEVYDAASGGTLLGSVGTGGAARTFAADDPIEITISDFTVESYFIHFTANISNDCVGVWMVEEYDDGTDRTSVTIHEFSEDIGDLNVETSQAEAISIQDPSSANYWDFTGSSGGSFQDNGYRWPWSFHSATIGDPRLSGGPLFGVDEIVFEFRYQIVSTGTVTPGSTWLIRVVSDTSGTLDRFFSIEIDTDTVIDAGEQTIRASFYPEYAEHEWMFLNSFSVYTFIRLEAEPDTENTEFQLIELRVYTNGVGAAEEDVIQRAAIRSGNALEVFADVDGIPAPTGGIGSTSEGDLITGTKDQLLHLTSILCGMPASVITNTHNTNYNSFIGSNDRLDFLLNALGSDFAEVLTRYGYEIRANVIPVEGSAVTELFFGMANEGASKPYPYAGTQYEITQWREVVEQGRDFRDLRTRTRFLYSWQPVDGESIDGFRQVINSSPEDNDLSSFHPLDYLADAEARFGRRDANPREFLAHQVLGFAGIAATFYSMELARYACAFELRGVPAAEALQSELGDVIDFTPPTRSSAIKGRLVRIQRNSRPDTFDLTAVEVP